MNYRNLGLPVYNNKRLSIVIEENLSVIGNQLELVLEGWKWSDI